jgi:WD40 repeat protein/uncharacterized caspase-like protein
MMGITSLRWDERANLILTSSADNSVKLWQATTGTVIRTFVVANPGVRGQRSSVFRAAMSDGAGLVAVASDDGLRLWDGHSGALLQTLEPATRLVRTLAMNRSGTVIIAAGSDNAGSGAKPFLSIHYRDSAGNWSVTSVPLSGIYEIDDVALSSKGDLVALAGKLIAHETPGGVETAPFFTIQRADLSDPITPTRAAIGKDESSDTQLVGFAPDGQTLFLRERDAIYRVSAKTRQLERLCAGWDAALSEDGSALIVSPGDSSGATNATVAEIRDTRLGDLVARVPWPDADHEETRTHVAALAMTKADGDVVAALNSGKLARWNRNNGAFRWIIQPRELGPRALHILDRPGRHLLLASDAALRVFDLNSGRQQLLKNPRHRHFDIAVMSPDGTVVAAAGHDAGLHMWSGETGELLYEQTPGLGGVTAIAFSPDGKLIAQAVGGNKVDIARAADGASTRLLSLPLAASALTFLPDGKMIAAGDELGEIHFLSLGDRQRVPATIPSPGMNATVSAVEPDASGAYLAVGYANQFNRAIIYDLRTGSSVSTTRQSGWINALAFDGPGRRLITVGQDQRVLVWDAATGAQLDSAGHRAIVLGVGLSGDGRNLATVADGDVRLWSLSSEGHLGSLAEIADLEGTNWIAVGEDGRFDTGDAEGLSRIDWVMPDDPLRPFAVDTYMRDFYEPRLLPRLLACHAAEPVQPTACRDAFSSIRPLAELNRVSPEVGFVDVGAGSTPDQAIVHLVARSDEDPTQANHKYRTNAYDLRLFRDGQLVGSCPQNTSGIADPSSCGPMSVALAHREGPVRFTAYAFNEDRVRSPIAEYVLRPSPGRPPKPARLYVIAIGVNSYAGGRGSLTYAAKDAGDIVRAFQKVQGFEVVPIRLLSVEGGPRDATRAKIKAVLDLLSGQSTDRSSLAGIDGAQRLERAIPDDIVIVTFSGHGFTAANGDFYLLAADSEAGVEITPERMRGFISSEQLRDWLAPIDAGQIALIIDACHSAASVDQRGFKPGPMGDRTLGQLAYDKGMRILAATQVDEVAIETEGLQNGLLTYALVDRGLGLDSGQPLADTNGDGKITLGEWLAYGEAATPALYDDALENRINVRRRNAAPDPQFISSAAIQAQTPKLFDYYRGQESVVLLSFERRAKIRESQNLPEKKFP